jgi:hypothetical protein
MLTTGKIKGKIMPVTGRGGPHGCETSKLPHFLDNRLTDGGEVVSLTRQAIPVTGRGGPHGCETSKLPHFLDIRLTDGGEVVSLTRRPPFAPRKNPGEPEIMGRKSADTHSKSESKTTQPSLSRRLEALSL